MSAMAGYRTVKQGEHLVRIAWECGFSDYHTIWDHPNNAQLKNDRQTPNVLFPGDTVFIPDRALKKVPANTGARHQFKVKGSVLKLRLIFEDLYERPIANAKIDLVLGTDLQHLTTDTKGRIEAHIRPDLHDAMVLIRDSQTPFEGTAIPIKVGDLDPLAKISGQVARLNNLGYLAGEIRVKDDDAFQSAVEEFQCDHPPLRVDGICGPMTQAELKRVHGC